MRIRTGQSPRRRAAQALLTLTFFLPIAAVPAVALSQPASRARSTRASSTSVFAGAQSSKAGSSSSPKCPISLGNKSRATTSKSGLLCHEGVAGQWFPRPAVRLLLKDLKSGRAALALQPKLERRIELGVQRVKLLELDVATSDKIGAAWRTAAEVQAKQLAKKDSAWRSPTVWFAIGLVLGIGGVTAAVVAK